MRINLVGGFLGSGKTTAIANAALLLTKEKVNIGIITNDQGKYLVDSHFINATQLPSSEVLSGCFCCNYNVFDDQISRLTEKYSPSVIFAESVGSCADLVATVVKPLIKFRREEKMDVTLSVFADARLLLPYLQGNQLPFSQEICYIFAMQLKEADILIVNKIDLLSLDKVDELKKALPSHFKSKRILFQNSLNSNDIRRWLSAIQEFKADAERPVLDIDYNVYGSGEEKLAWLDEEIELTSEQSISPENISDFIKEIYETICDKELPIGHLKFLITCDGKVQKISYTTLNDKENTEVLYIKGNKINLLINARIETDPAILQKIVDNAIKRLSRQVGAFISIKWKDAFKPEFPKPTHRMQ
jgi:G3E family GTPase